MSQGNSYGQILRSSSIIGGASFINIAIGLVRTKLAAMLLGPAGVGLIGLYTNLVGTASTVAGLGFGTVGTRQIAEAAGTGDAQRVATARRALFWGTLGLAVLGAFVFWLLRGVLSTQVLAKPALAGDVGWLALAVALTVAAASQNALLRGLRRVGDIARVSVSSALVATFVGVGALLLWGRNGLLVYVLAAPLASFMMGHWFVSRLPKVEGDARSLGDMAGQWSVMARLGFAFMVAGLAGGVGALVVRSLVQRELGEPALGLFQAAWAISMQYIGFVLGAMGTDFYPRLTAVITDHAAVNKLVNEQTEVALLLAAPVILAMTGMAPWVIDLLYTREFAEAAVILRWQLLGDVLKIASWPLGFILLAAGAGRTFVVSEWSGTIVLVAATALLLPSMGIASTGASFLAMYGVYLALVYALARRRTGFRWQRSIAALALAVFVSAALVSVLSSRWPLTGAALGFIASTVSAVVAIRRLNARGALPKRVAEMLARISSRMPKRGPHE